MYMFRKIVNIMCEWSHSCDESERSLMTSLNTLFLGPVWTICRSFWGTCADHSRLAWTKCCSSRRSPDEAMFHDGNFDHSVSSRVFFVGWRMHHACALSKIDSEPCGLRNPQTSAQLSGMDPGHHNGVGPGGVGKAQSIKASSIAWVVVSDATSPPSTIEKNTCNQVNFLRIMMARRVRMSFLAMPLFLA